MEDKQKVIFADGLVFKKRRDNAPDFIKGHLSVKIGAFVMFMKEHGKGKEWLNFDLKQSKEGKLYLQLDTWEKQAPKVEAPVEDDPFAGF